MSWFIQAIKKYAVFSGRSRRKEYWYFTLFYLLGFIALSLVDFAIGTWDSEAGVGLVGGIFFLILLLPGIAVTVRRLHDIDRTGWWYLINFIPLIGPLVLLVFTVQNGTPIGNSYGPSPKHSTAE